MLQILSFIRKSVHNKLLIRFLVVMAISVVSLIALIYVLNPDPKIVGDFIKRSVILEGIITIYGMLGSFSVITLLVFMLYHCGTNQFHSGFWKNLWLFLLVFANVLAAIVYYVLVFELRMTLKKDEYKVQEHG